MPVDPEGHPSDEAELFHLLRVYLGIDQRTAALFVALVVAAVATVTGIYIAIFGFDRWRTDMSRAGSMMIATYATPVATAPAGPPARPTPAAQYLCPACGAVGLPAWGRGGAPHCPGCGRVMAVQGR